MRISSFLSFFFSFHHFSLFSVVFHCFFNVFHCFALFFIVFNHPKFISIQNWNSYFRPLQLKSRLFTAQNFVCSTPVPCFLFFENSSFQHLLISKYWGLLQMKLACCKLILLLSNRSGRKNKKLDQVELWFVVIFSQVWWWGTEPWPLHNGTVVN